MLRIDEERSGPISRDSEVELLARVSALIPGASALVLSDYAKGVLTGNLCPSLIDLAREHGVPVIFDPKGRDFSRYAGATVITPNRAELALATGMSDHDSESLFAAAVTLRERFNLHAVALTPGENGMAVIDADAARQIPAVAREVFDVSGAGDTVAATLAAGMELLDAAHLANLAAGLVVGKVGTVAVASDDLLAAIQGQAALERAAKICDRETARERVRSWQSQGELVVFTNGCFDLLHVGHVTYLEQARRYGQRLVIGLNTDRSVRATKWPDRPLIHQDDRARLLAALASVDGVVFFDDETPLTLIEALRPDVLAKGADYTEDQVVGASEVKSWGSPGAAALFSSP
jgi:D-beta-D-heptose 7-phosphate kinase / D-beta-D-heptose 1-phosphate adenosyltransferase